MICTKLKSMTIFMPYLTTAINKFYELRRNQISVIDHFMKGNLLDEILGLNSKLTIICSKVIHRIMPQFWSTIMLLL